MFKAMTTEITSTIPLVLLPLPSGSQAAVVYTLTMGDLVTALLLTAILCLMVVQMWRTQRTA